MVDVQLKMIGNDGCSTDLPKIPNSEKSEDAVLLQIAQATKSKNTSLIGRWASQMSLWRTLLDRNCISCK